MADCRNCSAPLPISAAGGVVRCPYCGVDNRVEGAAPPPPQGFGAQPQSFGQPQGLGAQPQAHVPPQAHQFGPSTFGAMHPVPVQRARPRGGCVGVAILAVIILVFTFGCVAWGLSFNQRRTYRFGATIPSAPIDQAVAQLHSGRALPT